MDRLIKFIAVALALTGSLLAQVPASKHVYILAEENRSYEHLVGSPDMPYFNSLIAQGTLFTQFYANQHNSITDYFWVTAGQVPTTNNDTTLTYDVDSIVRHAMSLGLTYKAYAQTLPYAGFAGISSGEYLKRHTALPYYVDMGNSPTEMLKLVPADQLLTDVQNGTLPNFAFITPDAANDMHDCPTTLSACEQMADQFLQTYIGALLTTPAFQPGGDGVLIIWADEADLDTDNSCAATITSGCGGHIAVVAVGPQVKAGYQSPVTYHHENVLRTMLMAMGEKQTYPGISQTAVPMADMYKGNADGVPSAQPAPLSVTVQSPAANATVSTRMHVVGTASGPGGVGVMQVYVDGAMAYSVSAGTLDTYLTVAPGPHSVTMKAWDPTGGSVMQTVNVTAAALTVAVQSPAANATITGAMHVAATSTGPVTAMQVYVDGAVAYTVNAGSISTDLALTTGTHSIVVKAWDNSGGTAMQTVNVTAAGMTVAVQSPIANSTITGTTMHVAATSTGPVTAMQVYVDGGLAYTVQGASVSTDLPISAGAHSVAVKAWDNTGKSVLQSLNVTAVTPTVGVTIQSPAPNATINGAVQVTASAYDTNRITATQIYVDGVFAYSTPSGGVNTSLSLSTGKHYLAVKIWDAAGNSYLATENITVQ